jgi:hypothetical protein
VPLTADNVIQENTGTVTSASTSCAVSLGAGTTAGNTVIVVLSAQVGVTQPAGFALDKFIGVVLYAFRKSEVAADETSWTFTTSGPSTWSWYVAEMSNIDPVEPLDASAASSEGLTLSNGSTLSTGTTPLNAASVSYDAGSPTAVSSTEPRWQTAMWPSTNGWTQAEVDALALRVGFSTDATPDMGCDALYLEYATCKATAATVVGEAGGVTAEANINPNTVGVRSITLDTPADQGATLNWSVGGTPDSQAVSASSSHTETLDAADAAAVDYVEVVSDNELPDRE